MDPIIGEFTITSGSDPALFHTTFARSVNLDEGYELALKSIYHGPVNNLVFPKFILRSEGKPGLYHMLELTAKRFYPAPSDVLLEMHKLMLPILKAHELPTLFEKNGYLTLTMQKGMWIEVYEEMFLNSVFKYTLYDLIRQKRKIEVNTFEDVNTTMNALKARVNYLDRMKKERIDVIELEIKKLEVIDGRLIDSEEFKEYIEQSPKLKKLTKHLFEMTIQLDGKTSVEEFDEGMKKIEQSIDEIKSDYDVFERNLQHNVDDIAALDESLQRNVDDIATLDESLRISLSSIKLEISAINNHIRGDEAGIEYSADTSQIASIPEARKHLLVSTLAVTMTPIVRTKLAFLYASPVENSLINNKESRMLTPIPVTSKQGYNYVEFAQPLYRKISVRHFMDISFEILDKNGKKVQFNLYGDDLDQESREYPTILNLHIRPAIKGEQGRAH